MVPVARSGTVTSTPSASMYRLIDTSNGPGFSGSSTAVKVAVVPGRIALSSSVGGLRLRHALPPHAHVAPRYR
jgi:hypothetical protein